MASFFDPPASIPATSLDTDGTMAANSATRVPSQSAVVTYVTSATLGVLNYKGATDCSTNPNYPAASKGATYLVSVAGRIGGASGTVVNAGDWYVAAADNAGGTEAAVGTSWGHFEHNIISTSGISLVVADDIVTILAASSNTHYARSLSVPSVIRLATPNTFPVARTVGAADTEYGWTWLNRAALSSANENTTVSSAFYGAHGATNTDWTTGTYTCPTRYQSIMRGIAPFEVVARLYSNGDANYERSSLLLFDEANKATFIQVSVGAYIGSPSVYSYTGGVNTAVGVTSGQRNAGVWVRVVILGGTQWAYYSTSSSSTPPTSWTILQSYTLTLPVGALGVGHLICSSNTSNNTTGGVSWFGWMSYTPGVTLPWSGGIVPTGSEFQATAYAATTDTVPLIKSANFIAATTPSITALRLALADAINRLPGDAATPVFSCTGSASSNPAAATTFQSAASLVFKQAGSDTAADAAGYQYWSLHMSWTSAGSTQPGSIDTALVRLVV